MLKRYFLIFIKYLSLIFFALVFIVPILVVVFGAFKTANEFDITSKISPPKNFLYFENFSTAFITGGMLKGLINTAIIMIIALIGIVLFGAMVAFVLHRFVFRGKKFILLLYLAAMLIPMVTTQVTTFKIINSLGLFNTRWSAIVLYLGADVMSIYIMMQFMDSISISLDEAAMLEGASYFYIFYKLILPLLKPAIATIIIIKGVGIYNDFYIPYLYMPDQDLQTLSLSLYKFMGPYGGQWNVICAGIILIMIPTTMVFLLLQKYIYNGFVAGSVK
ncbi:carbohydrate ABC transporter permease [Clostridium sp. 19966]|nr:carbohydrate ABC transporter permease [Clostridium sp. 19966]